MIKKHLCTCIVVLVMLVLSKLFLYSTPVKNNVTNTISISTIKDVNTTKKERLFANLNFANEYLPKEDKDIERRMKRSLKAHSFARLKTYKLHEHAKIWFPVMEPILRQYGIPEDFKYLPLVESGLVQGTSHKGASGLWQFMPATARAFDLKVNATVDERLDIRKSTIAACKYLRVLYRDFGNWTLVAAAYNIGGGSLKKAMYKQNQDDYYHLRLNKETENYLYKLISTKAVIENPLIYGYKEHAVDTKLAMEDIASTEDNNHL